MGSHYSTLRYDATQVCIRPQFLPFTQCVPMAEIAALAEKLRLLPTTAFLSLDEFRSWLHMGSTFDVYTLYLFESLKTTRESKKVYAMELLCALAVCTSTSSSAPAKVDLLCSLCTHPGARTLSESDIAILLLSTINGLRKLTTGLDAAWQHHSARDLGKELLADAWQSLEKDASTIARDDFVVWCLQHKTTSYILRHFIPGDILNPSLPLAGDRQQALYASILASLSPDDAERAAELAKMAASTKIQAIYKGRLAQRSFTRQRDERLALRHAAAQTIQAYAKKQKTAQQLMARAVFERTAYNGAVLTFGAGLSLGNGHVNSLQTAPKIVPRLQGAKSLRITVSSSTTLLTTATEGFAWGHGLPLRIGDGTQLVTKVPSAIALNVAIVQQLALGVSHCLVLDRIGRVFSWGFNDHGQTGHGPSDVLEARTGARYATYLDPRLGEDVEYLDTPLPLAYFAGRDAQAAEAIPIAAIACGDFFSLALSRDGAVYSWGEGNFMFDGQLGHGTASDHLAVGFVDRRQRQSAFTFASEPKAVANLQDIVAIGCKGNRSAALARDHQLYEWGSWGRMLGTELPPAYAPQIKHGTQQYALASFALGHEHTIADGASVWLCLLHTPLECFVLLAQHARGVDHIRALVAPMDLAIVDLTFDDYAASPEDDWGSLSPETSEASIAGESPWVSSPLDTSSVTDDGAHLARSPSAIHSSINALLHKLWRTRCQEVQPTVAQFQQHPSLLPLRWCRAVKDESLDYKALLREVLTDIGGRLLLTSVAPPEGFYLELLTQDAILLELRGIPSNTCRMVTKRGLWTHFLDLTDMTSTELPLDNSIVLVRFTEADLVVKVQHLREETIVELVTASIAQKALTLQEYGVISIVLALDFHASMPFELMLPGDLGVYIPILMIDVDQCSRLQAALVAQKDVTARLFFRPDHTPTILATALELGATGVILQQRAPVHAPTFEGDVSCGDATIYRGPLAASPLVGTVSYAHGSALRRGAHYDDATNLLMAKVQFCVRPYGNIYAWGCAANGRLGLGPIADAIDLDDGYDAMTETTYRWTLEPKVVTALSGRDVVEIAAGGSHTLARTRQGRVFSWGRGAHGQLGHHDTHDVWTPTLIRRLAYENIVAVAANDTSSTVLCEALDDVAYEQRRKEIALLKAAHAKLPRRHHSTL
ncbi:hypothetical protein SPRG_02821 [Saprolegnia parasitica CBS 223.65]|uniref:Uncharacterized protein n=1 Tax=Saprolegnia parasitica (strain CBS 223.65) TaxID=695850 RepID=A0A067CZW6_SAPPC|nr:hypothetical protein SPRG_02821 [Saprolegnia parasitica CBS 223.65]KDO32342.1 hypothetical protein SPRG_02821 [Saprolegnia parasitica CBS 223.65]|eukprot:XP_012196798.1 hypothetical protein SPRG_02821 [Saprolegnia parasitica CBS 223.65]